MRGPVCVCVCVDYFVVLHGKQINPHSEKQLRDNLFQQKKNIYMVVENHLKLILNFKEVTICDYI